MNMSDSTCSRMAQWLRPMVFCRDQVSRYCFAVFATMAATFVRNQMDPVLHDRVPFGFYFLSVILTAWLGGTGPAVTALILGTLAAAHFVILPENSLIVDEPADKFALAIYFVVGAVAIALFHKLTTERRRFERQLRVNQELSTKLSEADRKKDEFMALLAHELRNPLAPIRSALDLLDRGDIGETQLTATRRTIRRQLDQLIRIVDDLLDVSRFLRGQMRIAPERIDLQSVVELALETVKPLLQDQEHKFHFLAPHAPVWVQGDRLRLTQVVSNLLSNAIKYTPRGGRIQVTLEEEGPQTRLQVIDNGIGIPIESQPGIFELFAQANPSHTREHGGLGLGLAIVKQITALHDGTIDVHSDGPGRGSRFTLVLPAALAANEEPGPASAATENRATERPENTVRGLRVMIVDDNADAAETLAALLTFDDCVTIVANDGPSALQRFEDFLPDVVLLDLGLPGMDGYEVARRMRARRTVKPPVIIAISGWGGEAIKRKTIAAGMDHHLVKPVDISELLSLMLSMPGVENANRPAGDASPIPAASEP